MPENATFTLVISSDTRSDEREMLLQALRTFGTLQEPDDRSTSLVDSGWDTYTVKVTRSGKIAEETSATLALTKKICDWRRTTRSHGSTPQAQFEHPRHQPLHLGTVHDEDVLTWLMQVTSEA